MKIILLVGVPLALIGSLIALAGWFDRRLKDALSGPLHAYQIQPVPQFLTDELALERARESLARDGYDLSVWEPAKDDRSKAPDGTPDTYLVRNTLNPNNGFIMFVNVSGSGEVQSRIVQIELKQDTLECVVWKSK